MPRKITYSFQPGFCGMPSDSELRSIIVLRYVDIRGRELTQIRK